MFNCSNKRYTLYGNNGIEYVRLAMQSFWHVIHTCTCTNVISQYMHKFTCIVYKIYM